MAHSSETISIYEAKNMLEERLTCQNCTSIFQEPRVLTCMHSFCLNCVESLEVQTEEEKHYIQCPFCTNPTEYPENGAGAISPAFHLVALLELYEMVKKVLEGDESSCENCKKHCAMGYCKHCSQLLCHECITIHRRWSKFEAHDIMGMEAIANTAFHRLPIKQPDDMTCSEHNEPLSIICETCNELICHSCTVRLHKEHQYELVSEAFPKHQQEMLTALEPLKQQIARITEALTDISVRENAIIQQGEGIMSEVQQLSQTIVEAVKQSEDDLYNCVQTLAQEKMVTLAQQKMELEASLTNLQRCENYVEEELRVGSEQQILLNKKQMLARILKITSEMEMEDMSPKEVPNLSLAPAEGLLEKCTNIGKVASAKVEGVHVLGKGSKVAIVGKRRSFDIQVKTNPPGFPITPSSIECNLVPAKGENRISCRVEEMGGGKYRIHYTPTDLGPHQLKVDLNKGTVLNIPFTIHVLSIPKMKSRFSFKKEGLKKPWGVCATRSDEIAVSEFDGHRIKILNKKGSVVRTFGERGKEKGQFTNPVGIAVTNDNHFLVVEAGNHRIQKLTEDGRSTSSIGGHGNRALKFNYPYDVAVSRWGQIYITDCYNHRIQVLNVDLTFAGMFGSEGTAPGQFKNPIGIAINSADKIYVADSGNERVQVFNLTGEYEQEIGKEILTIPNGITIDSKNTVYVTDIGTGQVVMFDEEGEYLCNYGNEDDNAKEFSEPTGICIDGSGTVFACDWGVNEVFTFKE